MVLAHILPDENLAEAGANNDVCAMFGDPASGDRAVARASLLAAILVNRTWYTAGVPILWRRPSEDALDANAIPSAARRAFYAAHIRHVTLSKRGALWRAMAKNGGVAETSEQHNGAGGGGGAAGRCDTSAAGNVALPQLLSLNVSCSWSGMSTWESRLDLGSAMRHNLAVVVGHISPRLEELKSFIDATLLDRLSALPGPGIAVDCASRPNAEATYAPRPRQHLGLQHGSRLRKLNLQWMHMHQANFATEHRLLIWLAQPGSLPFLTSVELGNVFRGVTSSLADDAFRHFAFRRNLKRLRLGVHPDIGCADVTDIAINGIVAWADAGRGDVEYVYSEGQFRLRDATGASRHQPFQQLADLLLGLESERSVVQLVPILAGLSSLTLSVGRGDEPSIDADIVLRSLSTLRGLRCLTLRPLGWRSYSGASLACLGSLTQLQRLHIITYAPGLLTDADLLALLTPLSDLRYLSLHIDMRRLSSRVVRVIGLTCRMLRVLALASPGTYDLAPSLENDCQAVLFPRLHTLELPCLETCSSFARYVENIHALSNSVLSLLYD